MPYMKGDDMLELIRNMDGLQDIKVIVYSSVTDKTRIKKIISNNIIDFISKGTDQKIIINKLNKHFGLFESKDLKKKVL